MLEPEHIKSLPANLQKAIAAVQSGEWEPQPVELTFQCATCEDRGWIKYAVDDHTHPQFGKMYPCPDCAVGQQIIGLRIKNRLAAAQLPPKYQAFDFASWMNIPKPYRVGKGLAYACAKLFVAADDHAVSMKAAFQMAHRTFEGVDISRNSLIFQGEPGLGKTGLTAAIIKELMNQNKAVLYIRVQDFLDAVKGSFDKAKDDKEADSTQDILHMVKSFPVLALDEFNMTKVSDWRQEIMENVIRYRYGNNLPTVLTCNADRDELERQWGIRTVSVLFEMAHLVPMGGEPLRDYRQVEEVF